MINQNLSQVNSNLTQIRYHTNLVQNQTAYIALRTNSIFRQLKETAADDSVFHTNLLSNVNTIMSEVRGIKPLLTDNNAILREVVDLFKRLRTDVDGFDERITTIEAKYEFFENMLIETGATAAAALDKAEKALDDAADAYRVGDEAWWLATAAEAEIVVIQGELLVMDAAIAAATGIAILGEATANANKIVIDQLVINVKTLTADVKILTTNVTSHTTSIAAINRMLNYDGGDLLDFIECIDYISHCMETYGNFRFYYIQECLQIIWGWNIVPVC
jgi:hypothetical protein